MEVSFSKMHGIGNDFVVIDDLAEELDFAPDAVRWFCDRHFGIGADGLILVRPATRPDADFLMQYYNADGSVAEMCGNGIRCLAKYIVDHDLVAQDAERMRVETLGGVMAISFTRDHDGTMLVATVDMGEPVLAPAEIPADFEGDQVFECDLQTALGTFKVTAISMGNPHAVIWVEDVDDAPVDTVGPLIETHERFPNKTNVEFAEYVGEDRIRLRVWERGVGETLACGTGACATLVAGTLACIVGREAVIDLPGGELLVRWDEDEHVYMTGPAVEVYRGRLTIAEDDA